jgi:hypothetical protein
MEPPPSLLEQTRGLNVLFVGNRSDEDLRDKLRDVFAFRDIAWAEASPRRISAATESISSGSYALVLGATGFLRHKEDNAIHKACRNASIPYVRVNRGRPMAVQLALLRDFARPDSGEPSLDG